MSEVTIKERLAELDDLLSASPFLKSKANQDNNPLHQPARTSQQTLEQAIDGIKLKVHYLVFDLEATKRENQYLRQMLEIRRPRKRDDKKDGQDSF